MPSTSLRLLPLHLLLALPFIHAAPPTYQPPIQAHFNCPDFPAPHWLPQTHYPRLYPFCIAFGCNCLPDARDPRGIVRRPVCDMLDFGAPAPAPAPPNLQHISAGLRVCQTTCGCYDGPASNWATWPDGPSAVGPLVGPLMEGGGGRRIGT